MQNIYVDGNTTCDSKQNREIFRQVAGNDLFSVLDTQGVTHANIQGQNTGALLSSILESLAQGSGQAPTVCSAPPSPWTEN